MSATGQLAKSRTYFCVMYTFELLDTNFGSCRIKAPTIAEVFVFRKYNLAQITYSVQSVQIQSSSELCLDTKPGTHEDGDWRIKVPKTLLKCPAYRFWREA